MGEGIREVTIRGKGHLEANRNRSEGFHGQCLKMLLPMSLMPWYLLFESFCRVQQGHMDDFNYCRRQKTGAPEGLPHTCEIHRTLTPTQSLLFLSIQQPLGFAVEARVANRSKDCLLPIQCSRQTRTSYKAKSTLQVVFYTYLIKEATPGAVSQSQP